MAEAGPQPALRLHQQVARRIGSAILSGAIAPGFRLEGEIAQSEAMGVSRTAYREAIRILTAKGLVASRPKAGTHVTPRGRWNLLDPEILAWMFTGTPDRQFIRDLFELRGIVEPAAASFAAERRDEAQLLAMSAALADMRRFGLAAAEGQEADRRFHRAILEATGNSALVALASSVGAAVQWTTHFKQSATKAPRDPMPEHESLFAAIAAADPLAAHAAMEELLRLALDDMKLVIDTRSA